MSSNRRAVPHVWHPKRHVGQIGPLPVAADLTQNVTPAGATVSITPGTPAFQVAISPVGATVTITVGTATLTQPVQSITPAGATVSITPGTATVSLPDIATPPGTVRPRVAWGPGSYSDRRSTPKNFRPRRRVVQIGPVVVTITTDQPVSPVSATVSITPGTPAFQLAISATGATVSVTPGTATVQALAPGEQAITPTGATVSITPGTATLTQPVQNITPAGATVTITAGTPALALNITPAGATVTITPGTVTVAGPPQAISPTSATVTVTPGTATVTLAQSISAVGATVTITPAVPAFQLALSPVGATVTVTPGILAVALAIAPIGATVTITAGTVVVSYGVPDPNPITLTLVSRAHAATIRGRHSLALRARGHTATAQIDQHSVHSHGHTLTIEEHR